MNLRNLFLVSALVLVIGGAGYLLVPETITASGGADLTPYGVYLTRLFGAANLAFGLLSFLVSGLAHSPARQAVVTTFFILHLLNLVLNVAAQLGGVANSMGWVDVAVSLLFALAFGYFRFIRPEESAPPGN